MLAAGSAASARRQRFFRARHIVDVSSLRVGSINGEKAKEALRRWQPNIVAVCGTSILKPATLDLCGPTVVNVHGGHLP
jgi:hypothetical protein